MNIQEIIDSVKEGHGDPLEAYILLKALEEQVEEGLKELKDLAIGEAEKYGKSFDRFGAHIEVRSAGSRWKYDHIGAWKSAKDKLTYVEKIAQAGGGADPDSGELIEKAIKVEGAQTIAIKLLKTA